MIEFGQPLALWGGLAVALPILAHMAYRRISEKYFFPSLRFLTPTTIPRSGKKRPSDWFLLLIRILLFFCIVMILADPYWTAADSQIHSGIDREKHIHLIDCSASMKGWGAWLEAKREVLKKLENKSVDHALLAHDSNGVRFLSFGSSKDELESTLSALKPLYRKLSPSVLFKRLRNILEKNKASVKVHIYSDFQVSDWQDVQADFTEFGVDLSLVPVGHGENLWSSRTGNRAIVDARVVPGKGGKARIWTVVRNWDENATPVQLSLFAGGGKRETLNLTLPARGTEQAQFSLPADGFTTATIHLDNNDSFSADNNRSLWLLPPPSRGFAFRSKGNLDTSDQAEKEFLQAVMESVGDGIWNRWAERRSDEQVDCLLLPGFSDWVEDGETMAELKDHLQAGGIALLTPGEPYASMNQTLRDSDLMNFSFNRLLKTEFRMDPYRIEALPDESPISSVFAGDSARDLYLTKIRKFLLLREWDKNLECPLYDRENRPLVLIRNFPSGGRLVFLCFRLLPDWTDLPTRNSFLPLLVELCGLANDDLADHQRNEIFCGEMITQKGESFMAEVPGLYRFGDKKITVHPLLSESMPEVLSEHEVFESLNGSRSSSESLEGEFFLAGHTPRNYQSLWMWFALAAGVLLIVETMLSSPNNRSAPTVKTVKS